ncbi:hypothetical protein LTR48_009436, partial [Friedmanniomyces endolithicus]
SPTLSTTPAPIRRLARSPTPPATPKSPRFCRRVCPQALRRLCLTRFTTPPGPSSPTGALAN